MRTISRTPSTLFAAVALMPFAVVTAGDPAAVPPATAQTPAAEAAAVPVPDPAPEAEPALALTTADPAVTWGPCPAFLPAGCRLAVLHGDPAQPNADVWLELPAGSTIARHWHTSAERMVLVAGELRVTYDGQPEAVLKPGSYAYGPARRVHSGRCTSDVACVLFVAFEGPVDATPVDDDLAAH